MTMQLPERLRYNGEDFSLFTQPLEEYFKMIGTRLAVRPPMSCLWRGYGGCWEISEGRLYLIGLHAYMSDETEANLHTIFPVVSHRVLAGWYSGTLHVPLGKRLDSMPWGYVRTYERDLLIDVERGLVMAERVRDNTPPDDDLTEHWRDAIS